MQFFIHGYYKYNHNYLQESQSVREVLKTCELEKFGSYWITETHGTSPACGSSFQPDTQGLPFWPQPLSGTNSSYWNRAPVAAKTKMEDRGTGKKVMSLKKRKTTSTRKSGNSSGFYRFEDLFKKTDLSLPCICHCFPLPHMFAAHGKWEELECPPNSPDTPFPPLSSRKMRCFVLFNFRRSQTL